MKLFRARQRGNQTYKKQILHRNQQTKKTMIHSEEAVSTQTLALLPPPLIFGRIPKCFDTAV